VTVGRETGRGDRADIAEAEDRDLHAVMAVGAGDRPRRDATIPQDERSECEEIHTAVPSMSRYLSRRPLLCRGEGSTRPTGPEAGMTTLKGHLRGQTPYPFLPFV
jgi:hypothetical protein